MKSVFQSFMVASLLASGLASRLHAKEVRIEVQADKSAGAVSRYLTGACIEDVNHEIYGGLYSQMIFGESFQEPVPSPRGFNAFDGRWTVRDGVLHINGLDGPKLISDHCAFADGVISVELLFADRKGENAGLIVRVNWPDKGAHKFMGYEVSLDAARQTLRLGRYRNNFEAIKDVKCTVPIGQWIALDVKLAGSKIEIMVDGKTMLRHDDGKNAFSAGAVGLRAWHCEASYRNLRVKTEKQVEQLAFEQTEEMPEVSGMWRGLSRGKAKGRFAFIVDNPFVGMQSQQVTFESGSGEFGVENQGLNRWGMNFVAGKAYEGYVLVRAEKPTTMFAALESRDGSQVYAETPLTVTSNEWQRLDFTMTPGAADKAGRFTLKLKQPGSVVLGYAFLQPGEWGRFKGLPVRRDIAEGLINQGITVLRYGGSMANNWAYKWKNMIGPRDRRPPYAGTWYRYSSNGWGIPDFMNLCEAAGFEYIPTFNMGETPQAMADFIEYAKGSADSEWARKRIADGHPAPYRLKYLQLGNEQRVNAEYAKNFEGLARAIWAKDSDVILVVGDYFYERIKDPDGAAITTLAAHKRILQFAKENNREVWFDVHVGTVYPVKYNPSLDGMFYLSDALAKIGDGARFKVVIFELNADIHTQQRALANALAINAIERDGRTPIVTSANGLQPDGQNDNGWNQGLLFFNPSTVWLQAPGYVTQMISRNYLPQLVQCNVTGGDVWLDVNAKRSEDGKTLVMQIVNPMDKEVSVQIHLAGFTPTKSVAQVAVLAGPLGAMNTGDKTDTIVSKQSEWQHQIKDGNARFTFAPYSFTIIRFE